MSHRVVNSKSKRQNDLNLLDSVVSEFNYWREWALQTYAVKPRTTGVKYSQNNSGGDSSGFRSQR